MRESFVFNLHQREIAPKSRPSKGYRKIYSDRSLIRDLDIVNELDGHSGCVNALSWSKGGSLLASGSDDQHLNIHSFQPDHATSQFSLATTVATGHTANIFSVKFMPHHNDRIVVTAAGDAEVRVFDLEHAGQTRTASNAAAIASEGRCRGRSSMYNGVRYLSDGDTDARVYRSHGDRVKRIVTESSPFLFLTCSEDGEVRQWDLRQPSSAYPSPRGGRYGSREGQAVPPALISYKRYNLDLNTISCSASQPHYIALGGAHLHALLHDRRMAGRDRVEEAGKPVSAGSSMTADTDGLVSQATRCVRKFAPTGQRKMKRTENGHITACKISDARPDELIASWSGDHIYSFDLVRSPDASSQSPSPATFATNPLRKVHDGVERKRKRRADGSESSGPQQAAARASSRPRTGQSESAALRIRYGNGQSEDIPLSSDLLHSQHNTNMPLRAQQQDARRIAKSTVNIRSSMFGSGGDGLNAAGRFTDALGHAASVLPDMDEAMRSWMYPVDPSESMVYYSQTLRRNRESSRRFVQASGTLARVLGGQLHTPSGNSPMMAQFTAIETRSTDAPLARHEQFGYDFLKAVLLWLDSGIGRLIEGFTRPADVHSNSSLAERLPIPENDATMEAVDDILIAKLLSLASDKPVVDVSSSRFETDASRQVFANEKDAVRAFAAAVKIPFADLSSAALRTEGSDAIEAQDRQAALRYWGLKVGRGILLNASEGTIYTFVDRAFGGTGRVVQEVVDQEARMQEIDGDEQAESIQNVEFVGEDGETMDGMTAADLAAATRETSFSVQGISEDEHEDDDVAEDEDDGFDEDDEEGEDDEDDSSEADEEDGVPNAGLPRFVYRSAFERRRMRERVEAEVPCAPYVRKYSGHCNVRTVKDVNYFGLDDEYVVSGSDDGNFFVWDARTSELMNVLEGDGEVVNVIQGHPHETMLAVSGIDHTIKIFSPDSRAREAARLGNGVSARDPSSFSSLSWPNRMGGRRSHRSQQTSTTVTSEPAFAAMSEEEQASLEEEEENYVAPSGLRSRKKMQDSYRIVNQNDVDRQGGNQESYITLPHAHLLQLLFGNMGNVDASPFD